MSRAAGWVLLAALALSGAAMAKEPKVKVTGVVNLNNATASQLDLLPGVGEKAAKAIITYRQQAPFKRIEDLVKVKGFGKKRFEKMRPFLAISGETTIKPDKPAAQARAAPRKF